MYTLQIGSGITIHTLQAANLRLVLSRKATFTGSSFSVVYSIQAGSFVSQVSQEDFEQISSKIRIHTQSDNKEAKFIALAESLLSLSTEDKPKLLSFINEMTLFAIKHGIISDEKAAELKAKIEPVKPTPAEATPLKACSTSYLIIQDPKPK
jgi:hypothetical protein